MLVNTSRISRIVSIFSIGQKPYKLRTNKSLTIPMNPILLKMIKLIGQAKRKVGNQDLVISPAVNQDIVGMNVANKMLVTIRINV